MLQWTQLEVEREREGKRKWEEEVLMEEEGSSGVSWGLFDVSAAVSEALG